MMVKFFPTILFCILLVATCKAQTKCGTQTGEIKIATYIDGAELLAKGLASPVGNQRLVGPRLDVIARQVFSGAFCDTPGYNNTLPADIPSDSVAGFRVGDDGSKPEITLYLKAYNAAGQRTDCVLGITVMDASPEKVFVQTFIEIRFTDEKICKKALPTLKIYETGKWCEDYLFSDKVDPSYLDYCSGLGGPAKYGNTFMLYFDSPKKTTAPELTDQVNAADSSSNSTSAPDQASSSRPAATAASVPSGDEGASAPELGPASSSNKAAMPFFMLLAFFSFFYMTSSL
jgi:hypothetical protein